MNELTLDQEKVIELSFDIEFLKDKLALERELFDFDFEEQSQ